VSTARPNWRVTLATCFRCCWPVQHHAHRRWL
jgi:hypothetical protein